MKKWLCLAILALASSLSAAEIKPLFDRENNRISLAFEDNRLEHNHFVNDSSTQYIRGFKYFVNKTDFAEVVADTVTFTSATVTNLSGGRIGEIMFYVSVSTPSRWLTCHGQSLSTTTYSALYAVIGYSFGGAGANFNIPDARGRNLIGAGTGGGLSPRTIGDTGGSQSHTLDVTQIPSHQHNYADYNTQGVAVDLVSGGNRFGSANTTATGGGLPHNIMDPFLVVGVFIYAGI